MSRILQSGLSAAALLVLSSAGVLAQNSILVSKSFSNFDNAGPGDPRPFSDAAQAQFVLDASLLGAVQTNSFESLPITTSTLLHPGPDLAITFNGQSAGAYTVSNTSTKSFGYNTTRGGSNFLAVYPSALRTGSEDIVLNFSAPVQAFGSYFTGLESTFATETIVFEGGSNQSFTLDGSMTGGGVTFFGFTAVAPLVTQIVIHVANTSAGRDLFGIDDMQYVVSTVPEPGTVALALSLGITGAGFLMRRKRNHMTLAS